LVAKEATGGRTRYTLYQGPAGLPGISMLSGSCHFGVYLFAPIFFTSNFFKIFFRIFKIWCKKIAVKKQNFWCKKSEIFGEIF